MRHVFLLALVLFGCSQGPQIPSSVSTAISKKYDIDSPVFAYAKDELLGEIANCGEGVVKGVTAENRCAYQIDIDDIFMRHPAMKTGFVHADGWEYKDGVTFQEPTMRGEPVPDHFDLRESMKGGMPDFTKAQVNGDCWAWATRKAFEQVQAIYDQKVVSDSVQSIIDCSGAGTAEQGGTMAAVDFLKHGLPFQSDYPYVGRTQRCKFSKDEIATGWDPKALATPNVGNSLQHSRGSMSARPTVEQMKAAIFQNKAPLVVTVAAYSISGPGVYNSCSAVNSGGNHMVTIIGFDKWQGKNIALVWNSWGANHGVNGVSKILWECNGGLNRGLGVEAKVIQYKPPCDPPVVNVGAAERTILEGTGVKLGSSRAGQTCVWSPAEGLSDAHSCETWAQPSRSIEYHVTASNACASASGMTLVKVLGEKQNQVLTPAGSVMVR